MFQQLVSVFHKPLEKREEKTFPSLFYEANIIMIPKSDISIAK